MKTMRIQSLFATLVLCLAVIFTGCKKEDDPILTVSLTPDMLAITGLSSAPEVVIDNNAKKIDISVAYEDASKLAALPVAFENLPAGVTITPSSSTFDFANGKRNNITIAKDGLTATYSVGASVLGANPRFLTAKLNGNQVAGAAPNFTVKLTGMTDLTKVIFKYTVSPNGTVVALQNPTTQAYVDLAVADSIIDFSDKLNGRNFKLTVNGVSNIVNIKVTTSGFSAVEKVWAKYANIVPADAWYSAVSTTAPGTVVAPGKVPASPGTDAWERNIAMDDNYIYMARGNKGFASRLFGVYAVSITNPDNVVLMDTVGMQNGLGAHMTTDVNIIPNGTSNKLLVCNLANAANNNLKVWAYDCKASSPEVSNRPVEILNFNVGVAPNPRLGDKFTVEGTWQSGKLIFFDYNKVNSRYYVFTITNGVVNQTPQIVTMSGTGWTTGTSAAGIYRYSSSELLFSGTGTQAMVLNAATNVVTYITPSASFPLSEVGDCFVEFNDQKYLAYLMMEDTNKRSTLRLIELNGATLAESMEKWNNKASNFNIAHPDAATSVLVANGNSTGKVITRVINGTTYIAVVSTNHGVSLFKLK